METDHIMTGEEINSRNVVDIKYASDSERCPLWGLLGKMLQSDPCESD
jgi:hypothetical protein